MDQKNINKYIITKEEFKKFLPSPQQNNQPTKIITTN